MDKLKKIETGRIVKSFLNDEALKKFAAVREMSTFYKLYKVYDNTEFWRKYSLGFKLNSLVWFLSGDGASRVRSDYGIFHLKISPKFSYDDLELGRESFGENTYRPKKSEKNIAAFLR